MTLEHALKVFEESGGVKGTENKAKTKAAEIIVGPKDKSLLHDYILEHSSSASHEHAATKLNVEEFELYVRTVTEDNTSTVHSYMTLKEFNEG